MKSTLNLLAIGLFFLTAGLEASAQAGPDSDYPQVLVETSAGNFTIELFAARSPISVENFLKYVADGFYEGTVFHRVVPGFVVQGGGYDEKYQAKETRPTIANESGNGLNNRRGQVAMARTGDPHSADSQFYINLGDNLGLDPLASRWGYAVFGRVTEGLEVVDQIGYAATGPGPIAKLPKDVPVEAIVITRISLVGPAVSEDPAEQAAEPAQD
jgi:peptidyl-prolyl cis-trans isomerase A (cyclophilin A)